MIIVNKSRKLSIIFLAIILLVQTLSLLIPKQTLAANHSLEYKHSVSYGGSTVGYFLVDGEQAFCMEHKQSEPPNGSYGTKGYDNENVRRALYYGLNGPKDIFKNKGVSWEQATVVTSLIVSRMYSGDTSGSNVPMYNDLLDKALHGDIPDEKYSFSDKNLNVGVDYVKDHDGLKQVSQTTTFKADAKNKITFTLPDGMHLYNLSTNHSGTGNETIEGGQSFFLWAEMNYNNNWSKALQGSIGTFQPLVLATPGSKQTVGRATPMGDPPNPITIKANFYPRTVQMTIHHKDRQTNEELDTETKTVTIGTHYEEHSRDDFWHNNIDEFEDGDQTASGTVPSNNFDVTLWYHTKWTIHKQYIDTYDGHVMWTEDVPNVWAGQWYDEWPSTGEFDRDGHHYRETGNNHYTGNMPRGDLWIQYYYDEYNHTRVTWKNQYPNNDVFQYKDDLIKVGDHYFYDQPATFTIWNGAIFDRNDGSVFDGNQPNWDQDHTFLYRLRRHVTVNYYDNRTGQKIKDSKEYDLHQGDHWDEYPPVIKTNRHNKDYTYRYVREDGSSQSGTVGQDNVTVNYYYDIPLVETGIKKIQVYTAPHDQKRPVRVWLDKQNNYDSSIKDMGDKKISVTLNQGGTTYATKTYSANDLPEYLTFDIPANVLEKNQYKLYTVRLGDYDSNDFDVISSERELSTDGYTSNEGTYILDVKTDPDHQDFQKLVVMTETIAGGHYDFPFYEQIDYNVPPLPKKKTGYGVETKVDLEYQNELGSDYQYGTSVDDNTITFQAPKSLQDSYLDYPIKDDQVNVPLKKSLDMPFYSDGRYYRSYNFIFPHVNVEKNTGSLFTDKQRDEQDPRIKHDLSDGGNKFYTPIWPKEKEDLPLNYSVSYLSNGVGVNKIKVDLEDNLKIYAYFYAWMGSPTLKDDAILLEPVNTDNPFPDGLPEGWTKEDEKWIEKD